MGAAEPPVALLGGLREPPLDAPRLLDQAGIDHALALVRGANEPVTAVHVAEVVGVSRATAQRYLADLVKSGRVTLTLRYGRTRRPEHHGERRG